MAVATQEIEDVLLSDAFSDLWEVVVLDNPTTPFDTVLSALMSVCQLSYAAALRLTRRVDEEGEATVAVHPEPEARRVAADLESRGCDVEVRPLSPPVSDAGA